MSAAEAASPTDVDGLRLERPLGQGGMGVVHQATEVALDRTIAVKALRDDRVSPGHIAALLAEARITSAVTHPSVVPIHDVRLGPDGRPRILLERIEGRPWNELLRDPGSIYRVHRQPVPLVFHIGVLIRVCSAVHAAHTRGIVHRDLKPGNVMVAPEGDVWLLDWGLAVTLDPDADPRLPRLTASSKGAGTPQYMAPEMVSPRYGTVGPWTDVYLLGGLLFQVLWGRPPHDGATSWAMVLEACRSGVQVPDDGPPELVELCRRCLARDPTERIQDAETVRRALVTWMDHRSSVDRCEEGRSHQALLQILLEDSTTEEADKARIHELFGATVFAYHRALEAWPENPEAREGLAETVRVLVEHAVANDESEVARAALGYLRMPPRELIERVESAESRRALRERQQDRWRTLGLGALRDGRRAGRERTWLLAAVGAMLATSAGTALVATATGTLSTQVLLAAAAVGLGPVLLAVTRVVLRPLSALDQRIAGHLVFYGVARILVLAAAVAFSVEASAAAALELGLVMVLASHQALAFRQRLWIVAALAALCAVLCVVFPPATALLMSLTWAVLVVWLLRADLRSRAGPISDTHPQ